MGKRTPEGPPPPPPVQKLRLQYAKRGRLRFTSHRDIARAFERALRRAQVPMAFSAGFSPHPKISWVGASPTGVGSEAEYVEISLSVRRDPEQVRDALDASLPDGLDVVAVVEAPVGTSLPDRVQASSWRVEVPGVEVEVLRGALERFLAAPEVGVQRLVKDGVRDLDARAPVLSATVTCGAGEDPCATLHMVVRHVTPAVRPDDVLSGLRLVADLETPVPPRATRVRQGPLTETGEVGDPLAPDRGPAPSAAPTGATRQDADRVEADAGGEPPRG